MKHRTLVLLLSFSHLKGLGVRKACKGLSGLKNLSACKGLSGLKNLSACKGLSGLKNLSACKGLSGLKNLKFFFCLFSVAVTFCFWGGELGAHPVSYKGSKGIMGYHSPGLSHNQVNYSFEHWWALGVHHIRRTAWEGQHGTFATTNFLLKRWNGEKLQANVYMNLGVGSSSIGERGGSARVFLAMESSETSAFGQKIGETSIGVEGSQRAGIGLLQFDIEDRNFYFLCKQLRIFNGWGAGAQTDLTQTMVRLGLAPYVVNFDGIHSWLILEWQELSFFKDQSDVEVTPFVRVFYKNLLFEIGQSFDGATKFNYITHF